MTSDVLDCFEITSRPFYAELAPSSTIFTTLTVDDLLLLSISSVLSWFSHERVHE